MLRRSNLLARLLLGSLIGLTFLLAAGPAVPTAAKSAADRRFGLDFVNPPGKVGDDPRFGAATTLGVGWDRFPMYWSSMQPTQGGPIDFSGTDATIAADQG